MFGNLYRKGVGMFGARRMVVRRAVIAAFAVFAISAACVVVVARKDPLPDKQTREQANTEKNIVNDVTELNPVQTQGIVVPHTTAEIVAAVTTHKHVSIGGGRNSMGGQTASERAVQIDMREYNKVLSFSTTTKEITVQSGIRWRDIQDYIDPYDLSVKIMQTYSNFTVGGSLSVNVHGRYVGLGPVILSVKKFTIVLADGSVVEASPTQHTDIFYSAIGGMGGIGVIADVTLALADNVHVERSRTVLTTNQYREYFKSQVAGNPGVLFHNGDMYPPDFSTISAVSWTQTDKAPTTEERLIPRKSDYWKERIAWVVMSEWPAGRWIRQHLIDPLVYAGVAPVHTRNYEASYDIAELEPESRSGSTYVLQEYFVPVDQFDVWVPKMKKVFADYDVNVLNVSIRHAMPDPGAALAWARTESFAFVVYYKQGTDDAAKKAVGVWTRAMIDQVLSVNGSYYLPYQPWATDEQFRRAYPGATTYFATKKKYDPADKFTNKLWDTYYHEAVTPTDVRSQAVSSVASTTPEYYRAPERGRLSLPEWYIVYSANEYAAVLRDALPSTFPFFLANKIYWEQYRQSVASVTGGSAEVRDYVTVLRVIGASFSAENVVKGVYENTIGRLSEYTAAGVWVPEDVYAATVAQDYATFIYDYPWYDFPYAKHMLELWSVRADRSYTVGQDMRRVERKLFLSVEYGTKALYSSLIRYATHTKFGVQDDQIHMVITRDGGATYSLVGAPHYQPFTRLLLKTLEEEAGNEQFSIVDIAGNDTILFTYQSLTGAAVPAPSVEIMRVPEIVGVVADTPQYKDRVTVEVSLSALPNVFVVLQKQGVSIDHFYDY